MKTTSIISPLKALTGLGIMLLISLPPSSSTAWGIRNVKTEHATCSTMSEPSSAHSVPEETISKLMNILAIDESGKLKPVPLTSDVSKYLELRISEIQRMNKAIIMINNITTGSGRTIVEADKKILAKPLAMAAKGYWCCVLKILKCEAITAACIAGTPFCFAQCAKVCVGTLGLACVGCISACTGGAITVCEAALDCWQEARNEGCIP